MTLVKWMWISWPAFLVAGLLEMMVFAMVDPQDLHPFGYTMGLSRQSIYSLVFFVFWVFAMLSSGLTLFLALPEREVGPTGHTEP